MNIQHIRMQRIYSLFISFSSFTHTLTIHSQVLPCFDEPAMKATWNVTVRTRAPHHVLANAPQRGAVQNTADGRREFVFERTPKMSSYLFCVVVSEFESREGIQHSIQLRTNTHKNKKNLTFSCYSPRYAIRRQADQCACLGRARCHQPNHVGIACC